MSGLGSLSRADLIRLPKVELHLHLDCSPSYEVLAQLVPGLTEAVYSRDYQLRETCQDLSQFLTKVPRIIALMQTEAQLVAITRDLLHQLAAEHVLYAEIRFAPLQHLEGGLSEDQVMTAVCQGLTLGMAETGVEARLILCTLRHFSEAQGLATVALADRYRDQHVVALDLAADEAGFPLAPHVAAFREAARLGLACTAHAGEACGPASVWETLEHLKPARIGHGVRSIEDPQLVQELVKRQIHLEVCPGCNVQIGVYPRLEDHPIERLFRAGVALSVNTDGRTVPFNSLTDEYARLVATFGWGLTELHAVNRHALRAAFLDAATRTRLLAILDAAYASAGSPAV